MEPGTTVSSVTARNWSDLCLQIVPPGGGGKRCVRQLNQWAIIRVINAVRGEAARYRRSTCGVISDRALKNGPDDSQVLMVVRKP